MDYSPFFAHTPQSYHLMAVPPTPSYSADDKLAEPLDTSTFLPPYDALRFHSVLHTSGAEIGDVISVPGGGVDGGLEADGANEIAQHEARENNHNARNQRRGSSEEKELTPAQSRRKAQNRAAQRAFRERKERHVKDLEAKLSALENSATSLASDNQRLKLALQRATTENEILRSQTSTRRVAHASPASGLSNSADMSPSADPTYSTPSPSWGGDGAEKRLLPAAATWDLIQSHPLVQQGYVDIADVCERLRGAARCDGSGPVFDEREVRHAVEESRRGGGDELI